MNSDADVKIFAGKDFAVFPLKLWSIVLQYMALFQAMLMMYQL